MVWIIKYAPQEHPEETYIIPRTYPTKELALATIPGREAIRRIEDGYGQSKHYTGPVVWMVEPLGSIESPELQSELERKEPDEPPYFAR